VSAIEVGLDISEPIRGTWGEQMDRLAFDLVQFPDRGDLVEDPESSTIGADDQVVEPLLDRDPVDRSSRQVVLELEPGGAVVSRYQDRVVGPDVEHSLPLVILSNDVGDARWRTGDGPADQLPALPVVSGLIYVGLEKALELLVDRDVGDPF